MKRHRSDSLKPNAQRRARRWRPLMFWTALLGAALAPMGVAPVSQAFAAPKLGATITVRVLNVKVMKTAKFIGATTGTAVRGTQLKVAEVKGDWYRVTGTVNGWVHRTSVEERAVALSARPGANSGSSASKDEIELAGRGFTPQVEGEYRKANPSLDFAHIDAIETVDVAPEALAEFVYAGGLAGADPQEQGQAAPASAATAAAPAPTVFATPAAVTKRGATDGTATTSTAPKRRASSTVKPHSTRVGNASAAPAFRGATPHAQPSMRADVPRSGGVK